MVVSYTLARKESTVSQGSPKVVVRFPRAEYLDLGFHLMEQAMRSGKPTEQMSSFIRRAVRLLKSEERRRRKYSRKNPSSQHNPPSDQTPVVAESVPSDTGDVQEKANEQLD